MSMIQLAAPSLTIAAPKGAAAPTRAHSAAAKDAHEGASGDFTLSLAAFLDQLTPSSEPPTALPGRHDPAAGGKELPVASADGDGDDDALPAVLAWLPPAPAPTPVRVPAGVTPTSAMMPVTLPKPPVILVPPTVDPTTAAPVSDETGRPQTIDGPPAEPVLATKGMKGEVPITLPIISVAKKPTLAASEPPPPGPSVERQPVARGTAPITAALPQQTPVTAPPQPAAQVFAAALARAAAPARDDTARAEPTDPVVSLATTPAVSTVAAPADARQGTLDMSQPHWPRHMIDHIEALRDSADANDTRIRLVPDALGTIDVSLKREGDAVRVHFTAEQHETRTLLADAAPKLAELAEQRGIRLTQGLTDNNVGTGVGGDARRSPERPQSQAQPRPAPADTSTGPTRDEDARVA